MKRITYFCDRCVNEFRKINNVSVGDLCDTCNAEFELVIKNFMREKMPKFGEVDSVTEKFFTSGKIGNIPKELSYVE